jgi:hypothetical protein
MPTWRSYQTDLPALSHTKHEQKTFKHYALQHGKIYAKKLKSLLLLVGPKLASVPLIESVPLEKQTLAELG